MGYLCNELTNDTTMYYQLSIVWVKNTHSYENYKQQVQLLLKQYDIKPKMVFLPLSVWLVDMKHLHPVLKKHSPVATGWRKKQADLAININTPTIIALMCYPSKAIQQQFVKSKAYRALQNLKREAIDVISYEGNANFFTETIEKTDGEIYNIELANYKNKNKQAYLDYETITEPKMISFGYQKTCFLTIDKKWTSRTPCYVKISCFKDAEGIMKFEDSTNTHQQNAYTNAVENLIWISAKALA